MRIRTKYLLWINGPLLLLLLLYIFAEQWADRADMVRLETRSLLDLGEALRGAGFSGARPRPELPTLVSTAARLHRGVEIMILDQRSEVRFSSVASRLGRRWHEPDIVEVLRQGQAVTWKSEGHYHGEVAMLDVTVPVPSGGASASYAIHVARRMELVEQLLRERRFQHTAWVLISLLCVGLVVNVVTLRWLVRPVNRITSMLAASRWSRPVGGHGRDELQRLVASVGRLLQDAEGALEQKDRLLGEVQSFNDKLEREVQRVRRELTHAQAELVRQERLAAVGELAAGLAHEVRNPLHIIRGATELLARDAGNAESCEEIRDEVDRINRFVNDLLDYTRPRAPEAESIEVAPVIRGACAAVSRARSAAREPEVPIDWRVDCPEDVELEIDGDHLRQVLVNLLSNAAEATAERAAGRGGGHRDGLAAVEVSGRVEAGRVCLTVRDGGCGIADHDLGQLFVPFFSRRPGGTGLGLAIVQRLVELYRGTIEVRSRVGEGTEVALCFATDHRAVAGDDLME